MEVKTKCWKCGKEETVIGPKSKHVCYYKCANCGCTIEVLHNNKGHAAETTA